jgi:hypothetical protein
LGGVIALGKGITMLMATIATGLPRSPADNGRPQFGSGGFQRNRHTIASTPPADPSLPARLVQRQRRGDRPFSVRQFVTPSCHRLPPAKGGCELGEAPNLKTIHHPADRNKIGIATYKHWH